MNLDPRFLQLLAHLYRAGSFGLFWTPDAAPDGKRLTRWFKTDDVPDLPTGWTSNVYFGVHPCSWRRTEHQKSHGDDIAAINCLYADFDGQTDLDALLQRLTAAGLPLPNVVIFSGGGLHCYWLLDVPYVIADEDQRAHIAAVQRAWVHLVDADTTVHDLARVLRVPGTLNTKPDYAPDFPTVTIVRFETQPLHQLAQLESLAADIIARLAAQDAPGAVSGNNAALDDQALLDALFRAKNGAIYKMLWSGDLTPANGDHSRADQMLANGLAWVCGRDLARMDAMFRQSGLMRPKWQRKDYREATLHNAANSAQTVYDPSRNGANIDPDAVAAAQSAIGLGPAANGNGTPPPPNGPQPSGGGTGASASPPPAPQGTPARQAKTLTFADIGREYIRQYPDTMYSRGRWHRYASGVWTPIHDLAISREIWALLENYTGRFAPSTRSVDNVAAYVRAETYVPEEQLDNDAELINLQNGTYSIELQSLLTHSKSRYLTTQLPFAYDPQATSPHWDYYKRTSFVDRQGQDDGQLTDFIQEAMGYSLTTDIRYHVTFWCYGEGANGKGVLFHVLERLAGSAAIPFNVDLLHREQYQLADLAGKRIALCPEGETNGVVEDAVIKALVAGDSLQVRQIRREPFTLRPTVKLWWSMNKLPTVTDTSVGFWRRVIVVPFNADFENRDRAKRIDDLKERLDQELPGIFNWAMEGFARLRRNNVFTKVSQIDTWTATYRQESNTIATFVDEICETDPGYSEGSNLLYTQYRTWCTDNGYKPYNARNFKAEMERLGYWWRRTATGRTFDGVRIKRVGGIIP